ncbi:Hypothetical protein AKI40_2786 [Enterobacter sp. FY-07]|nr:Hypothetical protein AKI40_2786 [Enterobacter sp. FY-07]
MKLKIFASNFLSSIIAGYSVEQLKILYISSVFERIIYYFNYKGLLTVVAMQTH